MNFTEDNNIDLDSLKFIIGLANRVAVRVMSFDQYEGLILQNVHNFSI